MFDNLYPTPNGVIAKMLLPLSKTIREGREIYRYINGARNMQVLEPSAGKGNICDYLVELYDFRKRQIYCIEQDVELSYILAQKGYQVIDSDFLTYNGRLDFDLVIMNPPFEQGVDHLLKAWEILRNGHIVCLLNSETVCNPFSEKRKLLLNLIEQFGSVEHIGAAFANSEHPTDVEVCIVRLKKTTDTVDFQMPRFEHDAKLSDEEFVANPLAHSDIIQSLVDQFEAAQSVTVEIHDLKKKKGFYLSGLEVSGANNPLVEDKKVELNEEIAELKKRFWDYVFDKTKFGQQTTSAFRSKIDDFIEQSRGMAFNKQNIMAVFDIFMQNRQSIMEQCVWSVFERATKYHEKNRIHTEGWKTNSSWKLNKKIIWPYGVSCDGYWHLPYRNDEFLCDLDKALCWVAGLKYDQIASTEKAIRERCDEFNHTRHLGHYSDPVFSTFFEIRFFKKGTIHLTFLQAELWQDFNEAVHKNWLGGMEK